MHISWDDARIFLAVAEAGSFSAAARTLRVTQSTVSRRLAALERRAGEELFARSVDGAALTAQGERLLAPARRMAEAFAEVEQAVASHDSAPTGVVRVTAPPGVAHELLAPFAAKLRQEVPGLRLHVAASTTYVDLVRRDADLALRAAKPNARDLVTLASTDDTIGAYASSEYIATLPRPVALTDIAWIGWTDALADLPPNPQLAKRIRDFQPKFASDDFLVQMRAAEAGAGAIVLPATRNRLALPSPLKRIDIDLGPTRARIHLVCARSALHVARVRLVATMLEAELRVESRVPR